MALKFYTTVTKGLKLKVRKFLGTNSYVSRIYRKKTCSGRYYLSHWLRVNFGKTELVIFKYIKKLISYEIRIKLCEKMIYPSNSVKHLDARIDKFLHWHDPVNKIVVKLNRDNALLLKIRNCIKTKALRNIYFAIFDSQLSYSKLKTLTQLKDRLFLRRNHYESWIYHESVIPLKPIFLYNILKIGDKSNSINRQVSPIFYELFTLPGNQHIYENFLSRNDNLNIPIFRVQKHGRFSIRSSAVYVHETLCKIT